MVPRASFSFIVPSYNSFRTISRTVQSILEQDQLDLVKEIIVVDSSDDGATRKVLLDGAHPLLKVIRLDRKTSPALGRNIGADKATGKILCFIDSDVELSPGWAACVARHCDQGVRVGGGAILVAREQEKNNLALAQYYLQFNEYLPVGMARPLAILPACNLFCERGLFLQAGGFPDIRASEDVLFCLHVADHAEVWLLPGAMCHHIFREDWNKFLSNQEMLGFYVMRYRQLHYNAWFYRGFWPVIFFPAFLFIKMGKMTGRIIRGGAGHTRRFLQSLPVFMAGLCAWAGGFFKASVQRSF